MKKILFISNICKGINNFAIPSIKASSSLNIDFHHAANWKDMASFEKMEADKKEFGIEIYHVPIARSPLSKCNITAYKEICQIIKEEKIDYIHCNTPVGGVLGRLVGRKCGIKKVLYSAHGFHFYKGAPLVNRMIYYPAERILAHFTDAIITMNKEDYVAAKKFKLRNKGKVFFCHGVGIDLNQYSDVISSRMSKRAELGFKRNDTVLISMGDLIVRKDYETAIRAIAKANDSNLHYLICGKGSESDNLKRTAKELGIERQVHFLGFRTDIKELLSAADIFLFTTLQEGLPRSMMEAMACGLPCIATEIRGNVDLIENGVGGFLCKPKDVEAFATAINDCNLDLRTKMGRSNLETIKQYDIHVVEAEMEKIYSEIFAQE